MPLTEISFYQRFRKDILAGRKTITIRDETEKDFAINSNVTVSEFETGSVFGKIHIVAVEPILFEDLSETHALQENMSLSELKNVISEIYPNTSQFYLITFRLIEI